MPAATRTDSLGWIGLERVQRLGDRPDVRQKLFEDGSGVATVSSEDFRLLLEGPPELFADGSDQPRELGDRYPVTPVIAQQDIPELAQLGI